jgi:hypothetical protein
LWGRAKWEFCLGMGENHKKFLGLRSVDIFCTLSVSCPEPWAISFWAHGYIGLLGTPVGNKCIKLINIFYITSRKAFHKSMIYCEFGLGFG